MSARELSSKFYAYVNEWKSADLSGIAQIHALVDRSVRDLSALHDSLSQRSSLETTTATAANLDGVPKQLCQQDKDNKKVLKPPPDLLSINDLRAVYTALEVLWRWCIQPSLEMEFGIEYKDHQVLNHPKTLLLSADQLKSVYDRASSPADSTSTLKELCFKATKVLLDVIHSTMFSNLMQGRFLGRTLFALLAQAVHKGGKAEEKNDDSSSDIHSSTDARVLLAKCIRSEVGVGAAKSSIIAALREASQSFSLPASTDGGKSTPATAIKVKASHCMRTVLISEGGLQAVLQGYLEGTLESAQSLKMKQHVARLITSVPQEFRNNTVKKREHYANVLGQLTVLYVLGVRNGDQQLVSILTLIVDTMAQLDAMLTAEMVMSPLAAPFLLVLPSSPGVNVDIYRTALEAVDSDYKDEKVTNIKQESVEYACSSTTLVLASQVLLALLTTVPLSRATYSLLHASGAGLGLVYAALHTTTPSGLLPSSGNSLRGLLESCCVEYLGRGLPAEVSLDLKRSALLDPVQGGGKVGGVKYHYSTDGEARLVVQQYCKDTVGKLKLPGSSQQASPAMDVASLLQAVSSLSSRDEGEGGLQELVASLDIPDQDLDSGAVLQQILASAASRLPGILSPQDREDDENDGGMNVGHKRIENVVRVGACGTALASLVVNLYSIAQDVDGEDSRSKSSNANNKVDGVRNVASELFMDCLRVFLAPEDEKAVGSSTVVSVADGKVSTLPTAPSTDSMLLGSKSLNGLLLLQLQSHVKMDILMHDLSRMLQLLLSFLISCTAAIDHSPHLSVGDGNDNNDSSTDVKTKPLIQIIGEEEEEEEKETGEVEEALREERETLVAVLGLLDTILSLSASAHTDDADSSDQNRVVVEMKQTFMQMLPYLQRIAAYEQLQSLSDEASDLCLTILTLGMSNTHRDEEEMKGGYSSSTHTVSSLIEEHRQDLYSDQPPLRAMGVKQLVDSLLHLNTNTPLEPPQVSQVVKVLVSLLRQEDESYVYLAILHALSALSQPMGQRYAVFEALLPLYRANTATEAVSFSLDTKQGDVGGLSHRQRSLVAEALMLMLRRAGGLGPMYVSTIIPTSLQVIRDTHPSAHKADLQGPLLLLRQSSISLLADAVKCAGPSIHKHLVDVLDVCRSVLTIEIDRGSLAGSGEVSNRNSRRAAAYVIKILVQQHGNALLKLPVSTSSSSSGGSSTAQEAWLTEADKQSRSRGGYMRDLYRLLKQVVDNDGDSVVQLHAGMAISLVADVVREELQQNVGMNEKAPTIKIL